VTARFGAEYEKVCQAGHRWPNVDSAWDETQRRQEQLTRTIGPSIVPHGDGSLVVFGSMARGELTPGSDLDWTLLIDGACSSDHLQVVHAIRAKVNALGFKTPGPTETFGGLSFSHSLVHDVGGVDDSNENMTRRLLLLLESVAVDVGSSRAVHERVVRAVLRRYVIEDASFLDSSRSYERVPRFLLNDVVRFWRTMAVDYAHKYRERQGDGWALRNIKLRMSRKLLFVKGLVMCLSWEWARRPECRGENDLIEHLLRCAKEPPLEALAGLALRCAPGRAPDLFEAYDAFLGVLADNGRRQALGRLKPEDAYKDGVFKAARKKSDRFDDDLRHILFEADPGLRGQVERYGVF
jgi:predicted nucleotidyltransferase